MDKENVDSDRCAISINSIACLNVCRRDLFRLRDRIDRLDSSLMNLESSQIEVQKTISRAVKDVKRLKSHLNLSLRGTSRL